MRVLIACEFSQVVCQAFRNKGHEAFSCDLEDCAINKDWHIKGDVINCLNDGWDLMIAHPPCTYLCSMGIWWNHKRPERWPLTYAAKDFVNTLYNAPINKIAIENPIGYLSNNWKKPSQVVNPWMFGDEAHKPTCLWLKNLPLLVATKIVDRGAYYLRANGVKVAKWSHGKAGGKERAKIASITFKGFAEAMANQWG